MKEKWKILSNPLENYSISNFGDIKNNKTQKLLNKKINSSGYLYNNFSVNNKKYIN